jgi:hypothetical protein
MPYKEVFRDFIYTFRDFIVHQMIESVGTLIAYACFSFLIGSALLLSAAGRACQRVGISQR